MLTTCTLYTREMLRSDQSARQYPDIKLVFFKPFKTMRAIFFLSIFHFFFKFDIDEVASNYENFTILFFVVIIIMLPSKTIIYYAEEKKICICVNTGRDYSTHHPGHPRLLLEHIILSGVYFFLWPSTTLKTLARSNKYPAECH